MGKKTMRKTLMFVLMAVLCMAAVKPQITKAAEEKFVKVFKVKKSAKDITKEIQDTLDKAAKKAKNGKRAKVYIPAGTYKITKTLSIDSNVYLQCDKKAKFIKKNSKMLYMLRSKKNKKKGYNNVKNITVEGGVWDAKFLKFNKNSGGTLFFFVHADNLEFKNLTLKNNYGTHLIELGGARNVLISGCKLYGFKRSSNNDDKEAIQLDVCHNYSILPDGMPYDDTPCANITIEKNEIYNYPRAIGSHTLVKDIYPSDITIKNNYIHDISQNAIYAYNYKNLTVENNKFDKVYAAVVFKTYAEEGKKTIFNRNKKVKAMSLPDRNFNILIKGNKINTTNKKVSKDTMQLGIFVYGTDKYSIGGLRIENNDIKSASTGIYLRYVKNSRIEGNTCTRKNNTSGGKFVVDAYKFLSCNKLDIVSNKIGNNGMKYENGFAFRENSIDNVCELNSFENVNKHGVGIYGASSLTVSGCAINNVGEHGIIVAEYSTLAVENSSIKSAAVNGITVIGGSKAAISNTTLENNGKAGISVSDKSEVKVTGSTIKISDINGITIISGSKGTITNSTIEENGKTGISVSEKSYVDVSGCIIRNNLANGITLADSQSTYITDNEISGNGGKEISVIE